MNATRLANNSMPRFEGEEMTGYDPFDYVLTGAFRDDGVWGGTPMKTVTALSKGLTGARFCNW